MVDTNDLEDGTGCGEDRQTEDLISRRDAKAANPELNQDGSCSSVKSHLLFHKALISEDDETVRFDKYVDLVEQLEKGMNIAFPDPFDRAIAITFELAIKYDLDPWDIDLKKFAKEYARHVKKNKDLDLVNAGRIILMAWKILKLQSDKVLSDAQRVQEEDEQEFWHEPDGDWFTDDDDFEFTTAVIKEPSAPLQEMIWHKGKRRVSLVELIGALEESKHEARIHKILSERRAEERIKLAQYRKLNINNKLHQENLQEDIRLIYERISKFNGLPIPLSDIHTTELEDKITTIVSSLFLAYDRKINIWQRKFPFGTIFVKNLNNGDKPGKFELEVIDPCQDGPGAVEDNGDTVEGGGNGGNGDGNSDGLVAGKDKKLIKDLDLGELDKMDHKKKKKLKKEMEEYITSQKNIAS